MTRDKPPAISALVRSDRVAWLLYLSVAVALGFVDYRVRKFPDRVVTEYIPSVLAGTSGAPAMYRVLAPYAISSFTAATGLQPMLAFLIARLLVIYLSLTVLHLYLRQWYGRAAAIAGTVGAAAWLPLTFTNSWAHPDSFFELALFGAGCLAIARRADLALYPILALAALNRETSVFLVLLWGVYRLREGITTRTVVQWASYGVTWAVIYGGLRWLRGFHHYQYWMLNDNLEILRPLPAGFDPYTRIVGYFWVFLIVPAAVLAVSGARRAGAPPFFTATLPVAATFSLICVLFSSIAETRIFLPLVPLLLPSIVKRLCEV